MAGLWWGRLVPMPEPSPVPRGRSPIAARVLTDIPVFRVSGKLTCRPQEDDTLFSSEYRKLDPRGAGTKQPGEEGLKNTLSTLKGLKPGLRGQRDQPGGAPVPGRTSEPAHQ